MQIKHCRQCCSIYSLEQGFTLVELMIAMAISGFIVSAIYMAYISQQRTYTAQDQVAEMQQNLRAAMTILSNEIRMAGYDGGQGTNHSSCGFGGTSSSPGILTVNSNQLDFSLDLNNDGDCQDSGERLTYSLYTTNGIQKLGRSDQGAQNRAVASNIDRIEFLYKDAVGSPTTTLAQVRSVQISMLARAGKPDPRYTNNKVYCPASNPLNIATGQCMNPAPAAIWGPYNDNYRRRLLITTINCRNLGL